MYEYSWSKNTGYLVDLRPATLIERYMHQSKHVTYTGKVDRYVSRGIATTIRGIARATAKLASGINSLRIASRHGEYSDNAVFVD